MFWDACDKEKRISETQKYFSYTPESDNDVIDMATFHNLTFQKHDRCQSTGWQSDNHIEFSMSVQQSDFNSVCRVCLKKSENLLCLLEESSSSLTISYRDMFEISTNILVSLDDGLPNNICEQCYSDLLVSYNFLQRSKQSDAYLRSVTYDSRTISNCVKREVKFEPYESRTNCVAVQNLSSYDNLTLEDNCEDYLSKSEDNSNAETEVQNTAESLAVKQLHTKNDNISMKPIKYKIQSIRKKFKTEELSKCKICGVKFKNHSLFSIHMQKHASLKRYACSFCDCRYSQKSLLKNHLSHCHRREKNFNIFTCEHCGKTFPRRTNLVTHLRIHTGEMPYACTFCPKRFNQLSTLIMHKRRHTGEKPNVCKICGKGFVEANHLKKHQSVHSDDKPFICIVCGKSVKSSGALKQHTKLHLNDKQYICDQCGSAFTVKYNLQTHIRAAHSEHSGQCSICRKMCSNLADHMVVHTGERPFQCDLCEKRFSHSRGLLIHARQHLNANKYKCEIEGCNKTFNAQWVLNCHMRKHTGVGQLTCGYCSKGFSRQCTLTKHIKSNHPNNKL